MSVLDLLDIASESALDWETLGYAIALLVLGVVLLVLEFFIVSFGALLVAAIGSVAYAIYLAFVAHDVAGWIMVVVTPVLGVTLTRWGLRRIRTSRVVPQSEITADAGYHHLTERLGIAEGAIGTLVTTARPSGRARFEGGECDVQVQGPPLDRGARVVVNRIDGPIVFVAAAPELPAPGG